MKVDKDSVRHVLALFDPEDIPFIKSENLLKGLMSEEEKETPVVKQEEGMKVKKLGGKNDRLGK